MPDQHPLTDAVCYEIGWNTQADYQDETDLMRAAADWQLEKVLEWIRRHPWVGSDCPIYDFEDEQDRLQLIADIKKSMRPQQQQETP